MDKKKSLIGIIVLLLIVLVIVLVLLFTEGKGTLSLSEEELKNIINDSNYEIQDKALASEYKKIKDVKSIVSFASSSAANIEEAKTIFDNFVEERSNYYNEKVKESNDPESYFKSEYLGCEEEEYYYIFTARIEYKISYTGSKRSDKYAVIVLKDDYINGKIFNTANLNKQTVKSIGDILALVNYNNSLGGKKLLIKSSISENSDEYIYTAYYAAYEPEKKDETFETISILTQYMYYLKKVTLRVNKNNGTTNLDISKFNDYEDKDSYYIMDTEIVNSYYGESYA